MTVGSWLRAAVIPSRGGGDGSAPLSPRAWRSTVLGLHVAFAVMIGIAVLSTGWRGWRAPMP